MAHLIQNFLYVVLLPQSQSRLASRTLPVQNKLKGIIRLRVRVVETRRNSFNTALPQYSRLKSLATENCAAQFMRHASLSAPAGKKTCAASRDTSANDVVPRAGLVPKRQAWAEATSDKYPAPSVSGSESSDVENVTQSNTVNGCPCFEMI